MSERREWTAERHAAAKDLGSLSGDGKRDALAEIERLAKVLGDAHAALDVEIGRGDKVTGYVFTLAERIGSVLSGLREETKRADDAEDKVDRLTQRLATETARANLIETHRKIAGSDLDKMTKEAARLKADLLLLGALKSEEVAPVIERFREAFGADVPQAPSGKRTTAEDMRERAAQEAERALIEYAEIDVLDKTPERIRIARRIRALPLCAVPDEPFEVAPPVRHARHDRHCMIGDGVGCSREPGCEVER